MPTEAIGLVLDGSAARSTSSFRTPVFKWIIALQRRTVERRAVLFCTQPVGG
jgi:hypothetical protein